MPPLPSANRRKSRTQRSVTEPKSSDHVAPNGSGLYQGTSIQDRVRHWQDHGAASAPPPDAVSVLSDPRSEKSITPTPGERRGAVQEKTRQERVGRAEQEVERTSRDKTEKAHRIRSASTPRKRVVSDEHWKATRSSKQESQSTSIDNQHDDDVIPTSNPSKKSSPRSIKQAKTEREERRRRRVEAQSRRIEGNRRARDDHDKGHIRTDPNTRSVFEDLMSVHEDGSFVQDQSYHHDDSVTIRGTSPLQGDEFFDPEDENDGVREKSKYAETLGRLPAPDQSLPRSKKGKFLNKTKEVLGIADPVPVVSNRLPSIEAWLDDQPDPFRDETPVVVKSEQERPNPLKQRSVKRDVSKRKSELPDPNKIWDTIDSTVAVGTREDGKKSSSSQIGIHVEENETSTVGLKRRGARASRLKRHTLPHVPEGVEQLRSEDIYDKSERQRPEVIQRECPQTGPTKLSTIASVETFHEQSQMIVEAVDPLIYESKPKVTTDEDMMTVLSRRSLRRGSRKKRSIRITNHQQTDPVKQILDDLAEDQKKYYRELRTLVDGVIPVLLQCVLSKSDAVAAAGLFATSIDSTNDPSFSRPVIGMGIALERIKSLHNRMPTHNVDSLLSWCQSAHKAYAEYLKAWRLSFQDVVVNLAPLEGSDGEGNDVMARNANGDIVNSDGETVDIAYLMKRPLVNIRKLGRTLSTIQEELPDHPVIGKIAEDYRELTVAAKTKHQQEKGRLEDEAASNVDPTKCRDIRDLGPLTGAVIEKNKRVRARDCFNMTLFHTTGQRMDCQVELILRDNNQDLPSGGDLLICQVDEGGKWLLFAAIDLKFVSARKGESDVDMVIMLRGRAGMGQEWHELMALKTDEHEAVSEWMIMLGSNPLPPKLNRVPTLVDIKVQETAPVEVVRPVKAALKRIASTETIDIPIGEPSALGVITSKEEKQPKPKTPKTEKPVSKLSMGGGLQKKDIPEHWRTNRSALSSKQTSSSIYSSDKSTISGSSAGSGSTYAPSSLFPMAPRQREKQDIQNQRVEVQQQQQRQQYGPQKIPLREKLPSRPEQAVQEQPKSHRESGESNAEAHTLEDTSVLTQIVPLRAPSLAPTENLPSVPKVRTKSSSNVPLTETIRDTWSSISGFGRKTVSQPNTPVRKRTESTDMKDNEVDDAIRSERDRQSWPEKLQVKDGIDASTVEDEPPPPPQHRGKPTLTPRSRNVPTLRPSEAQKKMERDQARLSRSPLRNEYMLSSESSSGSSTEPSSSSEDDSQTSEENDHANKFPKPAVTGKRLSQMPNSYPHSAPTTGTRTLAPSDSASQGPYRRVPSSVERPEAVKKRAIAMICSWSDQGLWEPLVEEYCSIVVSPGLMEAFVITGEAPDPNTTDSRPLVGFELTPLVPLRKGTGLDINIRSPCTPGSQIKTSSNILFRSRSAVECEALYQIMNWSRCNNPTYMELERSRPRPQPNVTFSNQQAPRPRSWFSFGGGIKRRNSYRVGNIPPSSMGESQTTSRTTSSAMSVLKRLTKNSAFNVDRSSMEHKPGAGTSGSLYSSSNGTGIDSSKSTPPPSQAGFIPGEDGPNVPPTSNEALQGAGMVHNMKIRLQVRRTQGWVTMGFSRLTILPAVKHSNDTPEASRPGSSSSNIESGESSRRTSTTAGPDTTQRQYRLPSSNHTPHRLHGGGREKRVVVTRDRDPSQVLLDATLGESCFERLSQLGIAIQVWRPEEGIRSRGGVGLGQNTTYLFQFMSAKECAWVFELVGRYRYGMALAG